MKKKEFKSSSKKVLDLMINSIYTNKEIFLRELISNASDALDKLSFAASKDANLNVNPQDLQISIEVDKDAKTLSITDNGIGMDEKELDENLGTIAQSGSLKFKEENPNGKDTDIIGQFGVGFYSAFMVAKKVEVYSKKINAEDAYVWTSEGVDGYTIQKCQREKIGTTIKLYLKDDTEDEKYSDFVEEYTIRSIIKKYSDYIKYPIKMEVENSRLKEGSEKEYETYKEITTINSMTPIWKKDKKDITEEEYNNFYTSKFMDYEKPLKTIHYSAEGLSSYKALLFIPSHAPYDFYYKEYKKGLELYTNGVLIMEKCEQLLPDYYSFVKGVVDTDDLSLNISRETLQNDKRVINIGKALETKIHSALLSILKDDFDSYKKFFKEFGNQIKFGIYGSYGVNKDKVSDLLIFYSSKKKDFITLKEYVDSMASDQKEIYYACGETTDKIDMLPQVEQIKNKNYDILYLTDYADEFTLGALNTFEEKNFKNVCDSSLDLDTQEEKEALKKENDDNKKMLAKMSALLDGNVAEVRITNKLKNHPVCLTSEGAMSTQMQKVLNSMPNSENAKAKLILEINESHPILNKLKELYKDNKEDFEKYTKILYSEAKLIEGLSIENPTEISNLICELLSK
ncbi:MAG: molecular chaperone HtpG [Bacilli bacterium]